MYNKTCTFSISTNVLSFKLYKGVGIFRLSILFNFDSYLLWLLSYASDALFLSRPKKSKKNFPVFIQLIFQLKKTYINLLNLQTYKTYIKGLDSMKSRFTHQFVCYVRMPFWFSNDWNWTCSIYKMMISTLYSR